MNEEADKAERTKIKDKKTITTSKKNIYDSLRVRINYEKEKLKKL
jgi:hypothetical protein